MERLSLDNGLFQIYVANGDDPVPLRIVIVFFQVKKSMLVPKDECTATVDDVCYNKSVG
jgi:hypothetical protein